MDKQLIIEDMPQQETKSAQSKNYTLDAFSSPEKFATVNKLIMRDLNKNPPAPTFYKYDKETISEYLKNPYRNAKALRDAVIYMYGASSHFRRLIQYFSSLTDLSYVVSPYKIDASKANKKTTRSNYYKTINVLQNMDIKNQFQQIVTVCLREDTFYGTMWVANDSITLQQLPSDYCDITIQEGNVFNVTFDFSYFSTNEAFLELYPPEFTTKYNLYRKDRTSMRWQELASPTSFAIKCNKDIKNYPVPPFVGILRDIYGLEDYKALKESKTELENYALIVMSLGIDKDGNWQMDLDKAKEFWRNLDGVLPEEVGSVLSPMPINKISFDRSAAGDVDTIAEAERSIFSSAGVSSLLFNNEKASSNALLLSIKADQALTYGIVCSIEQMVNRYIQSLSFGKNYKVTFLDCSPFNRKEMGDMYLRACQYGLPLVSYFAASQGLMQADMDCMNFLEDDVLGIKHRFKPLQSSATQSSGDAGRPTNEIGEGSDNTEIANEQK